MSLDWQTWMALGVVLLCALWFLRQVVRPVRSTSGCGTACSTCPSATSARSATATDGFVSMQSLVQSAERRIR